MKKSGFAVFSVLSVLALAGVAIAVSTRTDMGEIISRISAATSSSKRVVMSLQSDSAVANEDGSNFTVGINNSAWLGNGESTSASFLGLKFSGARIPMGAKIEKAELQFTPRETTWIPISIQIAAEAGRETKPFSTTDRLSTRLQTGAKERYEDNVNWLAGRRYSYRVDSVVQEIVGQRELTDVTFVIKGSGGQWSRKFLRLARGGSGSPRLLVTYTSPNATPVPTNPAFTPTPTVVATPTPTIAATPTPTATASTRPSATPGGGISQPSATVRPTASPTPMPTMPGHGGGTSDTSDYSHAMFLWSPTGKNKPNPKYDYCEDGTDVVKAHNEFYVIAPDGKRYPTWHRPVVVNPITNVGRCFFGHEHGRNPADSVLWPQVKQAYYYDANRNGQMDPEEERRAGIPFGYIAAQTEAWSAASGLSVMRHEDHVGHKVDYANDETDIATHQHDTLRNAGVVVANLTNFPNGQTGARCFYLAAAHQGTSTNDAFTNNLHEVFYFADCRHSDPRYNQKISIGVMETFGRVGGFTEFMPMCGVERRSQPQDFQFLGTTTVNQGYPSETNGSDREIQTRRCIESGFLVPSGRFSGNLYEAWPATLDIFDSNGRQLLGDVNLLFDVEDANRYFYPEDMKLRNGYNNPDAGLNIGYAMDLCYENFNGRAARGGPCEWTTNYGQIRDIKWSDPRSAFRGINRGMYFKPAIVNNAGGPTTWYTDPFGRNGRTTPFAGSVRQQIESKNINYSSLIGGRNIDPRVNNRLHDDGAGTVHAPN